MDRQENKGIPFFTAPNLKALDFIIHGFSTREGGVSSGHCATLNFGYLCEENQENVRQNYFLFCEALGVNPQHLVLTYQTHTTNIRLVTQEDQGKGLVRPRDYTDVDGLITNVPDTPLAVVSADCVGILLADPVQKVIAVAHAGWQGTVHEIAGKTVAAMSEHYGCRPQDIQAALGPAIGPCCYEVGRDVYQSFAEKPVLSRMPCLTQTPEGRYFIDLPLANTLFLQDAGLLSPNIHNAAICTRCHNDLFFSHRAQQGKKGLMAAIISIH